MAGQKLIMDSSTTDIFVLSASILNELIIHSPVRSYFQCVHNLRTHWLLCPAHTLFTERHSINAVDFTSRLHTVRAIGSTCYYRERLNGVVHSHSTSWSGLFFFHHTIRRKHRTYFFFVFAIHWHMNASDYLQSFYFSYTTGPPL